MLLSLWADQNYPLSYTPFMLLSHFAISLSQRNCHMKHKNFQNFILHDIFISLYVYLFSGVDIFDDRRSLQNRKCYTCSKLPFWNIQRIISHTAHFKARSHYQSVQSSFLILFINFSLHPWSPSHSPLNILWCIYICVWMCMYPFILRFLFFSCLSD